MASPATAATTSVASQTVSAATVESKSLTSSLPTLTPVTPGPPLKIVVGSTNAAKIKACEMVTLAVCRDMNE